MVEQRSPKPWIWVRILVLLPVNFSSDPLWGPIFLCPKAAGQSRKQKHAILHRKAILLNLLSSPAKRAPSFRSRKAA
jgi:hypothetical protein